MPLFGAFLARAAGAVFLAGALAACGHLPEAPPDRPEAERQASPWFDIEARFALRTERPFEEVQAMSGRLSWRHAPAGDLLRIAGPGGQILAELQVRPGYARLQRAQEVLESTDAASLLASVIGFALPLAQLPRWIPGDPEGRMTRFTEGWRIDYDYPEGDSRRPPWRITLHRDQELQLKLRIEEWRHVDP